MLNAYYYYPRNVDDPDRQMDIMARHLKRMTIGAAE